MSAHPRIALVGDFSEAVIAHRAIPRALEMAATAERIAATWTWVPTSSIRDAARDLAGYHAIWVVPASPYAHMDGALDALRWARETKRPALGSCGGFQHLVIEFARHGANLEQADTAETNPGGTELVVTALSCSLAGRTGSLRFVPGSHVQASYGADTATEAYNCNYGVSGAYRARLEAAGLQFTAFDETGEVRAAELPSRVHPFYVGTLFQSERAALRGETPPLARALVSAAARR